LKLAKGSTPWVSAPLIASAILVAVGPWYGLAIAILGSIFMIFFHRDPERTPLGEGLISPADGRILIADPQRLAVFMGPTDVHVTRSPVDGVIKDVEYRKGSHLPAFLIRSARNQQNRITLGTKDGEMDLYQITGAMARRIVTYVKPEDRVIRGERLGMIRFGSRVDVTIPPGYHLAVKLGDKVKAGETVIAVKDS
jgi:phosphatidylserine decarboxylase